MKRKSLFESFESRRLLAAGPYSPPAADRLSDAVAFDSPAIIGWADAVDSFNRGAELADGFTDTSQALGPAGTDPAAVTPLGRGGSITLQFDRPIRDGLGADFAVFENSFSDTFLELAYVEVSSDGVNFRRFDSDSLTPEPVEAFGSIDSTQINNLAGSFRGGFGTPFDLAEIAPGGGFDPMRVTHVRIVDVVGDGSNLDDDGDVIYDPFPTTGSAGFDLDGVGVIHAALAVPEVVDLDSVTLPAARFENNPPGGVFDVDAVALSNDFNSDFGSWQGFSVSSVVDTTTPGFMNQYASFPGGGADGSDQYAVAFQSGFAAPELWPTIRKGAGDTRSFESVDLANTTYAALSMRDGDSFAKQFGGPTGDDPDFFTVIIEGIDVSGGLVGEVEFDLADFRFDDSADDFIRDDWTRVNVSSIGDAAALRLRFESSDIGDFGINTPTYAAVDNVILTRPAVSVELPEFRTDEATPIAGQVRRGGSTDAALTVDLSSSINALTLPTSVTIPAGSSSVSFTAMPVDDSLAGVDRTATLTASAAGFDSVTSSLRINDDEPLAIAFDSPTVAIVEGEMATLTLRRNDADLSGTATVSLLASDGLSVPETVTFDDGRDSVNVNVTATDDDLFLGDVAGDVTATVGERQAVATVNVTDNDAESLTITLADGAVLREAAPSTTITATIRRVTGRLSEALAVSVQTNSDRLSVPASVTIPAGADSTTFQIGVVADDVVNEGTNSVTAGADGLTGATVDVGVLDDDVSGLDFELDEFTFSEMVGGRTATLQDAAVLGPDGFDNDAGGGPFVSGGFEFENSFTRFDTFDSWSGFAISDVVDVTTPGFGNQYAAFPGGGSAVDDASVQPGGAYAVGSAFSPVMIDIGRMIGPGDSLDLANTTYAALSMQQGDAFAKQFGGPDGTDPDFYLVTIEGLLPDGSTAGTIEVPLADFRFEDSAMDFIAEDWIRVGLAPLSNANRLRLSVSSSDVGQFGINTPAYFAIDNVTVAGVGPASIQLSRTVEDSQATSTVTLQLTGEAAELVSVPSQVTFPAGTDTVDVPLTLMDDGVVRGTLGGQLLATLVGSDISDAIALNVLDSQTVELWIDSPELDGLVLTITEGQSTTLSVRLADQPIGSVSVDLRRVGAGLRGASDQVLQIGDGNADQTMEFDASNFAVPQTVTLTLVQEPDLAVAEDRLDLLQLEAVGQPPFDYARAGESLVLRLRDRVFDDLTLGDIDGELAVADAAGGFTFAKRLTVGAENETIGLSESDERLSVRADEQLAAVGGVLVDGGGGVDTLVVELTDEATIDSLASLLAKFPGFERVRLNGQTQRVDFGSTWQLLRSGTDDDGDFHELTDGATTVRLATDRLRTNPLVNVDVNNDGRVSALDALRIINSLSEDGVLTGYEDVNGDGEVTARDALAVINALSTPDAGQPEPPSANQSTAVAIAPAVVDPSVGDPFRDEDDVDWWFGDDSRPVHLT